MLALINKQVTQNSVCFSRLNNQDTSYSRSRTKYQRSMGMEGFITMSKIS